MLLRWHPDEAIAHHAYWLPPGSIWVPRLTHQRNGDKSIQISMITTPTKWRFASHFGYRTWPTGGANRQQRSPITQISSVARHIFSIIPDGVGVEARFFHAQDVIAWRQSKTTGVTLRGNVVARKFAWANNRTLAGTDPDFDTMNTENDLEIKKEVEEHN